MAVTGDRRYAVVRRVIKLEGLVADGTARVNRMLRPSSEYLHHKARAYEIAEDDELAPVNELYTRDR